MNYTEKELEAIKQLIRQAIGTNANNFRNKDTLAVITKQAISTFEFIKEREASVDEALRALQNSPNLQDSNETDRT